MGVIVEFPDDWESINANHDLLGQSKSWISRLVRDSKNRGVANRMDSVSPAEDPYEDQVSVGSGLKWDIGPERLIDVPHPEYPTEQAQEIMEEIWPEVRALFLRKNAHYGETANELGLKGQYADIHRKVGPLKRLLWDGVPQFDDCEDAQEIASDMIGHLLLTLYYLRMK
jgi:hypothetical protein